MVKPPTGFCSVPFHVKELGLVHPTRSFPTAWQDSCEAEGGQRCVLQRSHNAVAHVLSFNDSVNKKLLRWTCLKTLLSTMSHALFDNLSWWAVLVKRKIRAWSTVDWVLSQTQVDWPGLEYERRCQLCLIRSLLTFLDQRQALLLHLVPVVHITIAALHAKMQHFLSPHAPL